MLVTLHARVAGSSRYRTLHANGKQTHMACTRVVRNTFLVRKEATTRKGNKERNARRTELAGPPQLLLLEFEEGEGGGRGGI